MPDVSGKLYEFVTNLRAADVPAPVMHQARRCFVDLIGVWAAGALTKPAHIARDHAAKRYGGEHAVAMPFDGRPVSPPGFAFAGAISIDAVDGHDGHQSCKGHAGAALLPALLAETGLQPAGSLDDFLAHLVVGYEVSIRAGLSLHATVDDYHSSGAWNALGCAAMAARIRGFNESTFRHALGIAEYYGPRAQMMRAIDHPTMVKDSSGWGSMVGISAADLAEDGFTGAPAITCEAPEVAELWDDIGQNWRMLEMNFKAFPVCRWAQPPIEAVRSLQQIHAFEGADVTAIKVSTFHEATRLAMTRPTDSDEVQYSLPITVALATLYGDLLPEHLDPAVFNQPEVLALADQITFEEVDSYNEIFPGERYAHVRLTLKDGRELMSESHVAQGNFDNPLSDKALVRKFRSYAAPAMKEKQVDRIAKLLTPESPALSARALLDGLGEG